MKSAYSRRYRRSTAPTREAAIAKKDNQQEQPFFSPASPQSFFKPNAVIQRKCEKCETGDRNVNRMTDKEEKPIQRMEEKKDEKPVMKMEENKEEKPIMKMDEKKEEEKPIQKMEEEKPLDKKEAGPGNKVADQTRSYVHSLDGKGDALPGDIQQFFKQRMGYDFSQVRIHIDDAAVQSAKELNAKAYAVGNHIVFNQGQYNPGTDEGKKLIAHELAHVAQQNRQSPIVNKKNIMNA